MKQALFSVRHSYFPKAGFEKITLNIGKSVAYITQQQQNKTNKPTKKARGFSRAGGFWLYRNLSGHFRIIWQKILPRCVQGVNQTP